jgi:hypothetical protein
MQTNIGNYNSCDARAVRKLGRMLTIGVFVLAVGCTSDNCEGSGGRSCCKVCTDSKACGDSCIATNQTCHQTGGCACDR